MLGTQNQSKIEQQRKRQLQSARKHIAPTFKSTQTPTIHSSDDAMQRLQFARKMEVGNRQPLKVRPVRLFAPKQGVKVQAQQARAELNAVRAKDRLRQYQSQNSRAALLRKLNEIPPCYRSSYAFVYALAATNIVLSLYKTVLIFVSDAIIDTAGTLSKLIPIVGAALQGVSELAGLATGITIGLVLGAIQLGFAIYIFIFIQKRTTFASRRLMNLAIIALSMLPFVELIPWVFLRLRHIQKEEKKNCKKRDEIVRKL